MVRLSERLQLTGGHAIDVNSRGTIASAIVLGTIGVLAFIVQPGLVQGFVVELGLSEARANDLAFIEMVGVAIATYLVSFGSRRVNWRVLVSLSLLLSAAGNLASAVAGGSELLPLARFVTGVGEGGIIATSFAVIGLTRKTERNLALYLVLLLTYGAVGLWLMPMAFATIGLDGIFVVWGTLTAVSFITVRHLPASGGTAEPRPTSHQLSMPLIAVAMFALLVFNSAIGIAWANLFLIGMQIRPDEQAIANALLLSQFVAIAGALVAIFLETRFHRWWPTIFGFFGLAGAISLLLGEPSYLAFVIAVGAFNFLWNMVLPFVLGAVSDMDESGNVMMHAIAMQMTGLGFGPFIAARILGLGGDFGDVLWTTIAMLLASFFILALPMIVHDRALRAAGRP